MNEQFIINLLRMTAAMTSFQTGLLASREMFGKSYFSLGIAEKAAVDQAVLAHVGSNYNTITPEFLAGQEQRQQAGFGIPISNPPGAPPASQPPAS